MNELEQNELIVSLEKENAYLTEEIVKLIGALRQVTSLTHQWVISQESATHVLPVVTPIRKVVKDALDEFQKPYEKT
jgi:hypothetical protein